MFVDDEKFIDVNKYEREYFIGWKLGNFFFKGFLGVFIIYLGFYCGIIDV